MAGAWPVRVFVGLSSLLDLAGCSRGGSQPAVVQPLIAKKQDPVEPKKEVIKNRPQVDFKAICAGIDNGIECARAIERMQLEFFRERVAREGRRLTLRIKNGREIVLTDGDPDQTDVTLFSFRDYLDAVDLYLLEVHYYEGRQILLVDGEAGEKYLLDSLPSLAPAGESLATVDLCEAYCRNRIQIWHRNRGHWEVAFALTLPPPREAVELAGDWVDNDTFRVTATSKLKRTCRNRTRVVQRIAGAWKVAKEEKTHGPCLK